jgi:hypothetical protein
MRMNTGNIRLAPVLVGEDIPEEGMARPRMNMNAPEMFPKNHDGPHQTDETSITSKQIK